MVNGISGSVSWNNIQQLSAETAATPVDVILAGEAAPLDTYEDSAVSGKAPAAAGLELPAAKGSAVKPQDDDFEVNVDIVALSDEPAADPTCLGELKKWPEFLALAKSDQTKVLNIVTAGKGNADVVGALAKMLKDNDFKALPAETKTSLLVQGKYYANGAALNNLGRLAGLDTFKDMELADQQRFIKVIGFVTTHGQQNVGSQQNILIDNTMDRILSGEVRLDFHEFDDDPGYITYGHSHSWEQCISLNSALIPAGDSKYPSSANARHAALSTVVHEISHAVNNDRNTDTYKYFQAEYRAWYVGYIAEYGKAPTRQQAYDRCVELFQCYPNIDAARTDTWFGLITDSDARKIISFVAQFSDVELNIKDPDSADAILDLKVTDPKKAAPIPDTSIKYDFDN